MQDRFSKFMGKLKIEIEGEEPIELDMKLRDKHSILTHMKDFNGNPTGEQIESLFNVFLDILKRSYPESDEEGLRGFLTQRFEQFMSGISIALGWTTKADLDRKMKELEAKADAKNQTPQ